MNIWVASCNYIQQNDCTISSFPITLWPWMIMKVIQSRIKLLRSVVSSNTPSSKQICLQVSWQRTMLNAYFIKLHQLNFLPWILLVQNQLCMSFHKLTGCGKIQTVIQIDKTQEFLINSQMWPWMKVKIIQTDIQYVELCSLYHQSKSERNRSVNI